MEFSELLLQKLNPSIEAPLSKLLDHIFKHVESQSKDTKYTVAFKDVEEGGLQKLIFTINSNLAGLPFTWKFLGIPAPYNVVSFVSHRVSQCQDNVIIMIMIIIIVALLLLSNQYKRVIQGFVCGLTLQ